MAPLTAAQQSDYAVGFAAGYTLDSKDSAPQLVDQALQLAQRSDKVVFFAGVPEQDESEGFNKKSLDLPRNQVELLTRIAQVNPQIIVVLQNGSVVTMPWEPQVQAILETYLAGEAVGAATWNILTGAVNPSGKLAETFPLQLADNPTYGTFNANTTAENYYESIYVGYRYYDTKQKPVRYPFGHGLSYTTFSYSDLKIDSTNDQVQVTFKLTNTGSVAGREVAQLYIRNLTSAVDMPWQELKGFQKITLQTGASQVVHFTLKRRSFAWYNGQAHKWQVDNGSYEIRIGQSSRQIELRQTIEVQLGVEPKGDLNLNTYLKDIIYREDLQKPLAQAGLQTSIDQILTVQSNSTLLENMPLRALIMLGAKMSQIQTFLHLVRQ